MKRKKCKRKKKGDDTTVTPCHAWLDREYWILTPSKMVSWTDRKLFPAKQSTERKDSKRTETEELHFIHSFIHKLLQRVFAAQSDDRWRGGGGAGDETDLLCCIIRCYTAKAQRHHKKKKHSVTHFMLSVIPMMRASSSRTGN